jgi:hypothetical protein
MREEKVMEITHGYGEVTAYPYQLSKPCNDCQGTYHLMGIEIVRAIEAAAVFISSTGNGMSPMRRHLSG